MNYLVLKKSEYTKKSIEVILYKRHWLLCCDNQTISIMFYAIMSEARVQLGTLSSRFDYTWLAYKEG